MRPGTTTDEQVEIKRVKADVKTLREDNEILKVATVFFASMPTGERLTKLGERPRASRGYGRPNTPQRM